MRNHARSLALTGFVFLTMVGSFPALAAVKKEQPLVASGIYSKIHYSPESGDLGGFELELYADGPEPYVEAVLCEGWCNESHISPIKWTTDGFTFIYEERYSNGEEDGKFEVNRTNLIAVKKGNILLLRSDNPESFTPFLLKRVKHREGLSVAHFKDEAISK